MIVSCFMDLRSFNDNEDDRMEFYKSYAAIGFC